MKKKKKILRRKIFAKVFVLTNIEWWSIQQPFISILTSIFLSAADPHPISLIKKLNKVTNIDALRNGWMSQVLGLVYTSSIKSFRASTKIVIYLFPTFWVEEGISPNICKTLMPDPNFESVHPWSLWTEQLFIKLIIEISLLSLYFNFFVNDLS